MFLTSALTLLVPLATAAAIDTRDLYVRDDYTISGYNSTATGNSTINAPGGVCESYITMTYRDGTNYDPSLCATDCDNQRAETNPFRGLHCHFFTSYQLVKNGQVVQQSCALYSRTWDSSFATNTGYTSGSDNYTIQNAISWSYTADIGGFDCPSDPPTSTTSISVSSTAAPTSTSTSSSTTSSSSTSTSSTSTSTTSTSTSTTSSSSTSISTTSTSTTSSSTVATSSSTFVTSTTSSAVSQPTQNPWTSWKTWGPLTACPQPVQYIVPFNFTLYQICIDTDYQIPSPQIYYSVVDNRACGALCDKTAGCTKAVYNLGTQTCYLKGSPSVSAANWQYNSGFQILNKVPVKTPQTSCLAPLYSITTSGKTFTVCPASRFTCAVKKTWNNVADEYACADIIAAQAPGSKFSYDWTAKTCASIGNAPFGQSGWVTDSSVNTYWTQ